MRLMRGLLVLVAASMTMACGGDEGGGGGDEDMEPTPAMDAAPADPDAGEPEPDAGAPDPDMGEPEPDPDMGEPEPDPDMGEPEPDPDMGEPEPDPDMGEPEPDPDMGEPEPDPDMGEPEPDPDMGEPEPDPDMGMMEPEGACVGNADQETLADIVDSLADSIGGCALQCILDPNQAQCATNCMVEATGLSAECAGCFGDIIQCTIVSCALQCIDANSAACADCRAENCNDDFVACAGIEPQ